MDENESKACDDEHPTDNGPLKPIERKVLVHVVDGLVIEESKQPFDDVTTPLIIGRSRERMRTIVPRVRRARGGRSLDKSASNLSRVKCESCGTYGTSRTFLKSGRFCSITCSKRYRLKQSPQGRARYLHPGSTVHSGSTLHPGAPTHTGSSRNRLAVTSSRVVTRRAQPGDFPSGSAVSRMVSEYHVPASRVFSSSELSISLPSELISSNPSGWVSQNVASFINAVGFNEYVQAFLDDDIDGESLLLLKLEHLVDVMRLPVGVALKINSHIAKLFNVGSLLA
ncbi:polyhomeotic-like protein 2 [Corticium candelabrum]|uniref:polyhomeotic-like protein 2 n=1 Tax=Corticium candelabrum TaxID=121492 RepID=UPI002E2698B7|nr:polyhomeotic-like protein 2 [Corticium candelabrum]